MTVYLVDTPTWIDFSKQVEPQASRLLALLGDPSHVICVCNVVVAEFMSGVPPNDRRGWMRFFASLEYLDVPIDAAARAGEDRYDLARTGRAIQTPDALIAATARAHGAVLITENQKDFPMPGLALLSLRESS